MTGAVDTGPLRRDLEDLVSERRASDDEADRTAYARDLWPRQQILTRMGTARPAPPGVVVWPSSVDEVVRVVRYAAEHGLPVVPFGAGSGVCGGVLATPETIVLDLKRMRRIIHIDGDGLRCDAEAGILGQILEDGLNAHGFTLGHFPSSIYCSTLGGWIAARSAGQCSGRYGKIEDMVLGLTCVDGRGEVWRAERDGSDAALLPLVIGSEGTLGVVTDARLRMAPAPPARRFASFSFDTTEGGLAAIQAIYQADLRPAVARLYDPFDSLIARQGKKRRHRGYDPHRPDAPERGEARPGMGTRMLVRLLRSPGALNRLVHAVPGPAWGGAMLVLVWEDEPEIADAERDQAMALCRRAGGRDTGEGPARKWLERRHAVSYRQSPMYAGGAFVDTMEVASTWSRLLPMYEAVRRALAPHVFVMAHFSHAYPDGASIYFTFAGSAGSDAEAVQIYDRAWRDALAAVVDAGGTLSHHHGVGRSKAPAMRREQGAAVDVVRALKRAMDPAGVLNPGALLPPEEGAHGA
ncbi:MAG: FAD-binding oxidoreductase [Myxococcota bacterium]